MRVYSYIGKDMKGKKIQGRMEAIDKESLIFSFRQQNIWLYKIKEIKKSHRRKMNFPVAMKPKEIAWFARELSTMLKAGVTVINGLEIISQQTKRGKIAQRIRQVLVQLEQGNTLSRSMEEQKLFPSFAISMVHAGEISGTLDIIFENISVYYEKQYKIMNKLKVSMTYPVIVCITALGMLTALFTFIFPTMMNLFSEMNISLPTITTYVMKISQWFQDIWKWLIVVLLGIVIGIKYSCYTPKGSRLIDHIKLKIPFIGNIYLEIIILQFTTTLSLLLHSGLSLITSLEMTSHVIHNSYMELHIQQIIRKLQEGQSFSKQAMQTKIFPPKLLHMIQVGEHTGDLEDAMLKATALYEQETEMKIAQVLAIFEPALIILMALIIGFIVLSVIQPMMELLNGINHI